MATPTPSPTPVPTPSSLNSTQAEDARHTLQVTVERNGRPVEGATVELHSTPQRTTTDHNGIARFTNVERGEHTLKLAYAEYAGEQKITVHGDTKDLSMNVTIAMAPHPIASVFFGFLLSTFGTVGLILVFLLFKKKKKKKTSFF